ncbi:MAG: hypothetical protein K2O33_05955 [Muribaculaceae bacterium]|nr:hypothetical protein [Muribaculaceae bacterium]
MTNDPCDLQRELGRLLDGGAVAGALLQELRSRYPFFTLPDALMLRRSADAGLPLPDGEERRKLMERVSLNSCDAAAAGRLVSGEAGSEEGFYPPEPDKETPTTESAIDTFLSSYGSRSDEEDALLERLIFNPVPDYALTMEAAGEEAAPAAGGIPVLPPPLPSSPPPVPVAEPAAADAGEPAAATSEPAPRKPRQAQRKPREVAGSQALLSESLAKIFIKTRRYDKAYEILERLSLEFPEKSRYFADQLRFLRKLILIEEQRRKQQDKPTD